MIDYYIKVNKHKNVLFTNILTGAFMIGIDILEVERIEKALKKENFLNRGFTNQELEYVKQYKNIASHLTGFFCAKEAVMKALEDCKKMSFLDIEIYHNKNGKPYVKLYNKAQEIFIKNNYKNIDISISQTNNYATAICQIN